MLLHGNVSNKFGLGVIIPILKEKRGDLTSLDNYRPITLSPVISKIFESVLPIKYGDYLYSDDRRFGFKKSMGCRNAIFAVRNIINYFNERGSNVYGFPSLDTSKAFDRVNHFRLYTSLMNRNVPEAFLNILINWHSKMTVIVGVRTKCHRTKCHQQWNLFLFSSKFLQNLFKVQNTNTLFTETTVKQLNEFNAVCCLTV